MKNKKGISLIVLVITIIVMIILSAAIILSLSNSGIISKANKAKADNDVSNAKELVEVAHSEWLLMTADEQTENGGNFVNYATDKLEKSGYDPDKYILSEEGGIEVCVAKIGEVKYASLQDAIDSAKENVKTVINLAYSINLSNTITIDTEKNIVIDMLGYSVTNNVGNAISNSGTLTLKDTSSSKSGSIVAASDKSKYVSKYDINGDGVVGQKDIDKIIENYNTTINDDTSEDIKKCDLNDDKIINLDDITLIINHYNDGYAVLNSGEDSILNIKDINKNNLKGEPEAIYNKEGSVVEN